MKDGRETGFLEEHRNGEPYALKGARTVRKGPERKGLAPVPRSQATLPSSSASTVSNDPRCRYKSSTSCGEKAGEGSCVTNNSYTSPSRCLPMEALVEEAGWVATIRRTRGPVGVRAIPGQS